MKQKLKLLLADDHKLFLSGLKLLLQRNSSMAVVGESGSGEETVRLFEQLQPDILLLDLSMPNMGGMECLREIKSRRPAAKVIILTMHEDENYIKRAMRAGASAYVHKSVADTDLFKAIEAVEAGQIYLSKQDSTHLLHALLQQEQESVDQNAPYVLLSPREREVLRLVARGHSLSEIAEHLSLSIKTIDTYKVRLMEKLHAHKKSDLVSYALKYGLLAGE